MKSLFLVLIFLLPFAVQAQDHYVFVGGYKNEKIPDYFVDNVHMLQEQGRHVDVIMPRSENSISRNADILKEKLLHLYEQGGRQPLSVIAHSKGGVELVNMILRHSDSFPKEILKTMIVVQSPLKGSEFTEKLVQKMDGSILALSPLYWMVRSYHAGGSSLATSKVQKDLSESASGISEQSLKEVSSRVFYVRSSTNAEVHSEPLQKMIGPIRIEGTSDGLVTTDEQKLEEVKGISFGQDLGIDTSSDHLDYFVRGQDPSGQRLVKIRQFTTQLMNLVEKRQFKVSSSGAGLCRRAFL